jgi:hypothetical protein
MEVVLFKKEYIPDEYKDKIRRFCMNLPDLWLGEFLNRSK